MGRFTATPADSPQFACQHHLRGACHWPPTGEPSTQEHALFGDDRGAKVLDVTFTPDFPRSGQLAREIWKQKVGGNVDGVLSIDPGALADVLGATGPVKLPTGQRLTKSNAVRLLLNTVYIQIADPKMQDQFFAATAGSVFDAMLGGQGKPAAVVDALAQAAREGRLMVWSAHKDEQALLSGTVLSGELVGVRGKSPVIGVYLNDGSAAKIGYYLRTDVVATPTGCRPGGAQTVNVKVTLTNTAPANAADLPPYRRRSRHPCGSGSDQCAALCALWGSGRRRPGQRRRPGCVLTDPQWPCGRRQDGSAQAGPADCPELRHPHRDGTARHPRIARDSSHARKERRRRPISVLLTRREAGTYVRGVSVPQAKFRGHKGGRARCINAERGLPIQQ